MTMEQLWGNIDICSFEPLQNAPKDRHHRRRVVRDINVGIRLWKRVCIDELRRGRDHYPCIPGTARLVDLPVRVGSAQRHRTNRSDCVKIKQRQLRRKFTLTSGTSLSPPPALSPRVSRASRASCTTGGEGCGAGEVEVRDVSNRCATNGHIKYVTRHCDSPRQTAFGPLPFPGAAYSSCCRT